MTTPAEFAAAQGLTLGAAPANFGIPLSTDPAYMRVVSTPGEHGIDPTVDNPNGQVSLLVMSDGTGVPAESSPYTPTNAGDSVSPQQVSQSAGSVPYADGILHAFPDDNPAPLPPPGP